MLWLKTELGGQEGGPLSPEGRGPGGRRRLGMGRRQEGETWNWGRITAVATTGTRFSINIGCVYKAMSVGKHLPNRDFEKLSFIMFHTTYQMLSKSLLCALQAHPRQPAGPFQALCTPMSLALMQRKAAIPRLRPRRPINSAGQ